MFTDGHHIVDNVILLYLLTWDWFGILWNAFNYAD